MHGASPSQQDVTSDSLTSRLAYLEFRPIRLQASEIIEAAFAKGHYISALPAPWSGPAGPSARLLPLPSLVGERRRVPLQPQRAVDFSRVGRRRAWQAERPRPPGIVQDADLQVVQRPPDPVRAHPVPVGRQPVAHVLEAAEGHVADGDVRPHPALLAVEDRPDPQVVLVGAEAGLDLGQPAVLDDQVARVGLVAAPGHDPPEPVPAGRLGHLRLVEAHLPVGEVEEPGGAAVAHGGRGVAGLQPGAQLFDPALAFAGVLAGALRRMGDDQPALAVLDALEAADRPRAFVPAPHGP